MMLESVKKTRFMLAVLFAPALPTVIAMLFGLASAPSSRGDLLILFFTAFTSYVGLFLIGLPLFYFLQRAGWLSLPSITISGGIAGIGIGYLFDKFLLFILGSSTPFALGRIAVYALLGFSIALLFSLIAGVPLRRSSRNNRERITDS